MSEEIEKIEKQLKTIAILYFVFAGFTFLMLLFLPLHYKMMSLVSTMEFPVREGEPDPAKMFAPMMDVMIYMYLVIGILGIIFAGVTLFTGLFLFQKKNRLFCIIGAAISCLSFPLGTALGIWTLLILFDNKTKPLFEGSADLNEADFLS
ncbi:hypothetical protein [Gimesia aquarii]|uniref:DUF4064 domain-containing protein n=1 Tax=Gimesia aquarii TaxID=2527964 RepID=A0A517WWY2_9PLAN|nr:hypothetical protein [Gimesia aquarii]QDU09773.1 hypothetical protein V202x_31690 [Gimesia aquarii]